MTKKDKMIITLSYNLTTNKSMYKLHKSVLEASWAGISRPRPGAKTESLGREA